MRFFLTMTLLVCVSCTAPSSFIDINGDISTLETSISVDAHGAFIEYKMSGGKSLFKRFSNEGFLMDCYTKGKDGLPLDGFSCRKRSGETMIIKYVKGEIRFEDTKGNTINDLGKIIFLRGGEFKETEK